MKEFEIVVDFNGIVLFEPTLLTEFYTQINLDDNLYERFVRTDDGDKVVNQGIVVPILAINDGIYRVIMRDVNEKSPIPENLIIVNNSTFPLKVVNRAILADMSILLEWSPEDNWHETYIEPGNYQVQIKGFREVINNVVEDYGFEFVLTKCESLPDMTASLTKNMQVRELPD